MSKIVIKAENISKQYRLGLVGTGTVRDDLKRWWYSIRGKEDPFLRIGESNDRSTKGESEYVWSLQDINFEIEQGDSVGIIGRNGAGKSTLLKILSQVTQPTTGKIYTKGRIASLLEVGTGFHPEMTGRENIYLNGAILGMRKHEITRKLDEIIAFSGVERYIDTPVKRYSSGMYVRLAFAVAAHLESEILIVDEVLAVGDAEFQKKCLGKMNDVSKGEGRTVLFVSHNLASVKNLCSRGIVLDNGLVKYDGTADKALDYYILSSNNSSSNYLAEKLENNDMHQIQVIDKLNKCRDSFNFNETIALKFNFHLETKYITSAVIGFRVVDQRERVVFSSQKPVNEFRYDADNHFIVTSTIPPHFLVPNTYRVIVALHIPNVKVISYLEDVVSFTIEETGTDFYLYAGKDYGCVFVNCKWE